MQDHIPRVGLVVVWGPPKCGKSFWAFDLAMHAWDEPFDRIEALAASGGVALATPAMGERLSLRQPQPGGRWWRELQPAAAAQPQVAAEARP